MISEQTIQQAVARLVAAAKPMRNVMGDTGVGVDLLVYSDRDDSRRSQVPGTVLYRAFKEGRVMYDAAIFGARTSRPHAGETPAIPLQGLQDKMSRQIFS